MPETGVQESGHLIFQPRVGFATVLVPASVTIALLANGFDDELVVVIVGGVVSIVDHCHVNFFFLVDDGFGADFGVGPRVHHLIVVSEAVKIGSDASE